MVEMFTVLENGQLEVNFEALELKTSTEFVSDINEGISNGEVIVKLVETEGSVIVKALAAHKCSLITYKFYKKTTTIKIEVFGYSDVIEYMELGGNMPK